MRIPSYLIRNQYGKYHFRISFLQKSSPKTPKCVFKRTLSTNDRCTAISLARAIKVKIDRLNIPYQLSKMNWLETKALLNNLVEETLKEYESVVLDKGTYGNHIANYPDAALEIEADDYLKERSLGKDVTFESYPLLKEHINKIIAEYALDDSPEKYDRNAIQVAEMLSKTRKKRLSLLESLYMSIPDFFQYAKKQFEVGTKPFDELSSNNNIKEYEKSAGETVAVNRKTLDELVGEFIEYKISKKLWKSPKTIELNKLKLKYISNVLECITQTESPYIDNFKREDAILFETKFQQLPSNLSKSIGPTSDIKSVISKIFSGELQVGSPISSLTYNGYCDLLAGMFHWATLPKQGYLKSHPFIDLKLKNIKSNKREAFTTEDIRAFFNTEMFVTKKFEYKYAWRYFVPIIMAHSGMRLEEVCQLQLINIVTIDGITCFDIKEEIDPETGKFITKTKNTGSSERIVPIHPDIKKTGFFRYVAKLEKMKEKCLFPDLTNISKTGNYSKSGAKVSKWFNEDDVKNGKKSYLSKCGINGDGKARKVLYSFRHRVETILINHDKNIEHDKIDILIGHQVTSVGRTNYGHYKPSTLLSVVKHIKYKDSSLPWDVNPDYNKLAFSWE